MVGFEGGALHMGGNVVRLTDWEITVVEEK